MSPTNPIPASQVEDFDEISQVMKTLLEGESAGDVAKLKAAFHPDARMFGQAEGQRYDIAISECFDFAAGAPGHSEGNYRARVLSVQQTGDVAFVVAVEENCWAASRSSTTFRSLAFSLSCSLALSLALQAFGKSSTRPSRTPAARCRG